ncbi:DUF2750 domain-containing protein [uncultured Acinetobacter sp.]|uniref:DUF2750 domain-containing protein n=1 Tax=uncultured Acinetobacter sp. TaxID=165433 RepID=UPI002629D82B|nr:DUF2750 domain-containing protein [uncultured Acinetobacter sp.]
MKLRPVTQDLFLKITLLKSMMYCGVLWGLYHQGWAMTQDQEDVIFPFWLSSYQAQRYAKKHWPQYQARKISSYDFNTALLPTLKRLNVHPTLYRGEDAPLKLTTRQMQSWFFQNSKLKTL